MLEQDFSTGGAESNGGWCLNTLKNKEVLREKRVVFGPPQYILFPNCGTPSNNVENPC